MLKIVQVRPIYFSDIKAPTSPMIRENNIVDLDIAALPKKFNMPPRDRQRIIVMANYNFKLFMNKELFEVASASCDYDIFTDRDVHLMELYRLAVSVAESLRTYIFSKNIAFLKDEEFPIDPPDVIRAKFLPELKKINDAKLLFRYELN